MKFTRLASGVCGIGLVLALCGIAFEQPILLFGAAGVGAWLLGRQRTFVSAAQHVEYSLTIDVLPSQTSSKAGQEISIVTSIELGETIPVELFIEPVRPTGGELTDASSVSLAEGQSRVECTYDVVFQVAGVHELPPLEITLKDSYGLFTETIERGPKLKLSIEPRGPSALQVGRGGSDRSRRFGAQTGHIMNQGMEPQEVREYVQGDKIRNIDWNATARLGDLHVRKFGVEGNQHATVILDYRDTMHVGKHGETKFAYAREVLSGYLNGMESEFDSVALYGVGAESIISCTRHQSANEAAATLQGPIFSSGTSASGEMQTSVTDHPTGGGSRIANRLHPDSSVFDDTIKPYVYSQSVTATDATNPIRTAIQRELAHTDDQLNIVLVTDDSSRVSVRETVQFASRVAESVTVFLTPQILFEKGGLSDLEAAYRVYLEFENFRVDLETFPNVTVFEVGPGTRLRTILQS